jgi:hypothetical protein
VVLAGFDPGWESARDGAVDRAGFAPPGGDVGLQEASVCESTQKRLTEVIEEFREGG